MLAAGAVTAAGSLTWRATRGSVLSVAIRSMLRQADHRRRSEAPPELIAGGDLVLAPSRPELAHGIPSGVAGDARLDEPSSPSMRASGTEKARVRRSGARS